MELPHGVENLWLRWVDLDIAIPYWNPYGASMALFVALVIVLNVLRALLRAQKRSRPGFTFAKLRAQKEKAQKARAAKAARIHHLESKQTSRF